MLFEKKIVSFHQLMEKIQGLDLDAGIRASGKYKEKKCLVFVTRFPGGFAVVASSVKREGKEDFPDRQLLAKEFTDQRELESFLNSVVSKPVKAFLY